MSLINISSYVFDKPTKWKILVTSNPVISFEDRNEAHWPGRDQCNQEHLDILLCLLSTVLLEEVRNNEMYPEAEFFSGTEGKKIHLGSAAWSADVPNHKI